MSQIRRRKILLSAGALLAAPLVAEAQQAGKTPRIGLLSLVSLSSGTGASSIETLRAGLRDLGYIEGRTIGIEYRSAEGRAERLPDLARELVDSRVDVIVTIGGNLAALAARKATSTIPIVMGLSTNAVEAGLVNSLARPGGNVTGLSVPRELGAKQIELLNEVVPSLSRVAIFARSDLGNLGTTARRAEVKALALEFFRVTLDYVEVQEPDDLARAFVTALALRPNALIVGADPIFFQQRDQIVDFARTARLPAMYPYRDFVDAGGLISYSLNSLEMLRVVTRHIDKILKGAKPADLPVEQPTKFELVINLKTARALGLTVPQSILLRADSVIE